MNRVRILTSAAALAAASILSVSPLAAQTVIVTSPGVKTATSSTSDQSDAFAPDTWLRDNLRAGASAGVSSTYPQSGNGSAYLSTPSYDSKADMEYFFGNGVVKNFTLGDLTGAGYDFYRDGSSTVASNQNPAMRFFVLDPTSGKTGTLVYEPVYNGVTAPATNTWNTVGIGGSSNVWLREGGQNYYDPNGNGQPLSVFQSATGFSTQDGAVFNSNSVVYGINFGVGSGWTGVFAGAVDNVNLKYADATGAPHDVTFNFEASQSTVPEPSSMALLGTGLFGLVPIIRRRRKR